MPYEDDDDIDPRLEALYDRASEHNDADRDASALRLFKELERQAKADRRVLPYLLAIFHQMDVAKDMLDPRTAQAKAVELIALLESDERARQIQPDLPEEGYEETVHWMTACAYDNFADATGLAEGYNSPGMHGCISDGIQVCHRTGKLACISCFREYALDVYKAADDFDLALHNARTIAAQTGGWANRGNRRWYGAHREGELLLLSGQVGAAEEAQLRALAYTEEAEVSSPPSAKRTVQTELDGVLLLAGKLDTGSRAERDLPREEAPGLHHWWDLRDALALCLAKRYDEAIRLLEEWDRRFTQAHCLAYWFEVRLRLIAAHRLAGLDNKVEPLARQLEAKAKPAQDFLTLRRLTRLRNPAEAVSPLALLAPVNVGPFASVAMPVDVNAQDQATRRQSREELQAAAANTPLAEPFAKLAARWEAAVGDAENVDARLAEILPDVLAFDPNAVEHWMDAARLLHFAQYLVGDGQRGEELWRWGQTLGQRFPQHASVLSHLATLGDRLHDTGRERLCELVPLEKLEQMFRATLDLEPDGAGVFARAGSFYFGQDNLGEAERCLARSFRLDRTHGLVANQLAVVYDRTDRPKDALWVLDSALREGCEDPNVAWHAAMNAHQLAQYEAMLTYLDKFDAWVPDEPWTNYYRAFGLLETGQPRDALVALEKQEQLNPTCRLPLPILRAWAASALEKPEEFQDQLREVLSIPLSKVDYLTVQGLAALFDRLWQSASILDEADPLRTNLIDRLLTSGMAPEGFFEAAREDNEVAEDVNFYRCLVYQPLDEEWPRFQGCLAEQLDWTSYYCVWGVLARDEEEAAQLVLYWQGQCHPLEAIFKECQVEAEGFRDHVGVVWQGVRFPEPPEEAGEDVALEEEE